EKEAAQLFQRFENPVAARDNTSTEKLEALEKDLSGLTTAEAVPTADAPLKAALKELQLQLEDLAWHPLYEAALQDAKDKKAAQRRFADQFTQIRLDTIERHEVAHLIDLKENSTPSDPHFEKYSELNAFYTELAYGARPKDVMAQALSGLIDELNR